MSTVDQRRKSSQEQPRQAAPGRRAALAIALLGLLITAATFVVPVPGVADLCWAIGFGLLFIALVLALVCVVRARGDRLSALPTSAAGWVSLLAFFAAVALAFTPFGEISLALGLVAAFSAVGAISVSREHSLPVITLPLLGGTFVLAFVLGELLIGHR